MCCKSAKVLIYSPLEMKFLHQLLRFRTYILSGLKEKHHFMSILFYDSSNGQSPLLLRLFLVFLEAGQSFYPKFFCSCEFIFSTFADENNLSDLSSHLGSKMRRREGAESELANSSFAKIDLFS